ALLGSAAPPPPPQVRRRSQRQPMVAQSAVKFKVTIPANTPLGIHDVRLVNKHGVSNPRAFMVGDLKEFIEKEPNNDVEQAQRVEMNSTVHGVIAAPTDVDYYVFAGKKGERAVISCLASSIDSRLYPEIELYSAAGKLLGANRHYNVNDALLDCTLPADGDYSVRVFNYTYTRGGPESFYRLSISTAPWIDVVYPPIVEPGKPAKLTVYGRNLPGGKLDANTICDGQVLEKV